MKCGVLGSPGERAVARAELVRLHGESAGSYSASAGFGPGRTYRQLLSYGSYGFPRFRILSRILSSSARIERLVRTRIFFSFLFRALSVELTRCLFHTGSNFSVALLLFAQMHSFRRHESLQGAQLQRSIVCLKEALAPWDSLDKRRRASRWLKAGRKPGAA